MCSDMKLVGQRKITLHDLITEFIYEHAGISASGFSP